MLAYVNGKSAGRVGHVAAHGCHRFTGEEWDVPLELACILHFESCPYSRWRDKFLHYSTLQRLFHDIPFPFYVDSIKFCKAHRGDETKLRAFWRRRKQWYYGSHADDIQMIDHLGLGVDAEGRHLRSAASRLNAQIP